MWNPIEVKNRVALEVIDVCVLRLKTIFNLDFYLTSFGKFCIQGQNCNFHNPFLLKINNVLYWRGKTLYTGSILDHKSQKINYNNQIKSKIEEKEKELKDGSQWNKDIKK